MGPSRPVEPPRVIKQEDSSLRSNSEEDFTKDVTDATEIKSIPEQTPKTEQKTSEVTVHENFLIILVVFLFFFRYIKRKSVYNI